MLQLCIRHTPGRLTSPIPLDSGIRTLAGASLAHKTTTIPLIRSEGRIECSAAELYTLLISKEGYELLDSDADPDEFNKPFLGPFSFERTGSGPIAGKVQLEHATLKVRCS